MAIFKMLIEKEPIREALFDKDSLIFLAAVVIIEIITYYVINIKKTKEK